MEFENVFWSEAAFSRPVNKPHPPTILAIGDSWFWYPMPGGSLLNQLGRLIAKKEHNILAVGRNGAEAYQYAFGVYEKMIRGMLHRHGTVLMGVFISGGGNDFAGINDLAPLLKDDCSDETTPDGCFDTPPSSELLRLMDKISESYITLIGRILAVCTRPDLKIFIHNYDYAYPSGKGAFGQPSTWLKAAMDQAQVKPELQHGCIVYILDEFTKRLKHISALNPGKVILIDGRNTLKKEDWENELHPTPDGFKKLAWERWFPALNESGLAHPNAQL